MWEKKSWIQIDDKYIHKFQYIFRFRINGRIEVSGRRAGASEPAHSLTKTNIRYTPKKNRIRTKIQVQHINRPHQAPIQSNHLMCDFKWPLQCCRLNVVLPESGYRNTTVWTTSLRPITDEINLNFGTKSSVCGYSSQVIIIIHQKKNSSSFSLVSKFLCVFGS